MPGKGSLFPFIMFYDCDYDSCTSQSMQVIMTGARLPQKTPAVRTFHKALAAGSGMSASWAATWQNIRGKKPPPLPAASQRNTLPVLAPCSGVTAVSTTTAAGRCRRMNSPMCGCNGGAQVQTCQLCHTLDDERSTQGNFMCTP